MIIYVLQLEKGKYYVGKTNNLQRRIQQHIDGIGSYWTKKYKFVNVSETFKGDIFDEDKTVKIYMSKYGIDNVRGGSYVMLNIPDSIKQYIKLEILMAKNECLNCGKRGHFISQCYRSEKTNGNEKMAETIVESYITEAIDELYSLFVFAIELWG